MIKGPSMIVGSLLEGIKSCLVGTKSLFVGVKSPLVEVKSLLVGIKRVALLHAEEVLRRCRCFHQQQSFQCNSLPDLSCLCDAIHLLCVKTHSVKSHLNANDDTLM